MLIVIYKWTLHPGKEKFFCDAWSEITRLVFARHGSFGSRLHHGDGNNYLAYAQWPDKQVFEEWLDAEHTPEEQNCIDIMQECAKRRFKRKEYLILDDQLISFKK
jgi:heme-degrading monooxygenase HmoA